MLSVRIHSSQYPSDIYVKEIENKTANILDIHGHTWKGVSQNKVKEKFAEVLRDHIYFCNQASGFFS